MRPEIACLIIPVASGNLIFPQNMLAEVLTVSDIAPATENSITGWIKWNRRRVPVVDFDFLCQSSHDNRELQRIVVLHTVIGDKSLPFIALQTEGIPHSVTVNELIFQEVEKKETCPYIISHLLISNLPCVLPDWPYIEVSLLQGK